MTMSTGVAFCFHRNRPSVFFGSSELAQKTKDILNAMTQQGGPKKNTCTSQNSDLKEQKHRLCKLKFVMEGGTLSLLQL